MMNHPCYNEIIKIIKQLRIMMFPEHFSCCSIIDEAKLKENIYRQILLAVHDEKQAKDIVECFWQQLWTITKQLWADAQAGFDNDPACESIDEVIIAYPGMFAIFIYRLAHALYQLNVPLIPRMMSEYAHSKTGIDIHPGATIGANFFIDHGTGVVIGQTCIIKNNVKIYQGVTLGAISTRGGQSLKDVKRHPTIEDNVTIYANATILGGDTIIGQNSVIGGNTFIMSSVEANSKVLK
ncbi:MAG: serine acetyltransferase [Erysipelotrichaceae bacterium]|nr:serine acetyltransferase [Erysipelotrichaceae bacterium]MDY5252232.1 serine O-acetyltransferase EpsC [Erysipelotrichaceae bacterium]